MSAAGRFWLGVLIIVFAYMLVILPTLRWHGIVDSPTEVDSPDCSVTESSGCGHP